MDDMNKNILKTRRLKINDKGNRKTCRNKNNGT